MDLEQEILHKLVDIKNKTSELLKEYENTVATLGYDIEVCSECNGSQLKKPST